MARGIVLHEDSRLMHFHRKRQEVEQGLDVPIAVHRFSFLKETQTATSTDTEASPDHNTCKEKKEKTKQNI